MRNPIGLEFEPWTCNAIFPWGFGIQTWIFQIFEENPAEIIIDIVAKSDLDAALDDAATIFCDCLRKLGPLPQWCCHHTVLLLKKAMVLFQCKTREPTHIKINHPTALTSIPLPLSFLLHHKLYCQFLVNTNDSISFQVLLLHEYQISFPCHNPVNCRPHRQTSGLDPTVSIDRSIVIAGPILTKVSPKSTCSVFSCLLMGASSSYYLLN